MSRFLSPVGQHNTYYSLIEPLIFLLCLLHYKAHTPPANGHYSCTLAPNGPSSSNVKLTGITDGGAIASGSEH
jgi:hypothetical protein